MPRQIQPLGETAGAKEDAGLAAVALLFVQEEQGAARRFPLHQQRHPLGPEPRRHLVHLPVGGEEHQARLLACQQAG